MHSCLYWLEDYFDVLSRTCGEPFVRPLAARLSRVCASLGDALAMRAHDRALMTPSDRR